jgi:hypothetical protein
VKKEYVLNIGNFNTRMIILGIGLTAVAISTYKCNKKFSFYKFIYLIFILVQPGLKRTIRNMTFSYFGFGLVVAPEIYNPFLSTN